jgi:acetyl esterase/lipase
MDELQAQRSGMAAMEASLIDSLGPVSPELEEFYHDIMTCSGWRTRVKVWRRKHDENNSPNASASEATARPLLLLFHGGGYCIGSIEQTTREGRELAEALNAVVISATYRLAPEHKFPIFVNDAIDIAEWMSENAEPAAGGFVVGGGSSGANAAAMIASEARHKAWRFKPTGLYQAIPSLLAEEIVPAGYRNLWTSRAISDATMTPEMLELMLELQGADVRSPLFTPFNSPLGVKGMPPTYIQVGGKDPLRDDGIVFAKALEDAGVDVRWNSYDGLGHAGWSLGFDEASAPRELKENTMQGIGWLLGKVP